MNTVTILNCKIQIKEWKSQRVVTFKDIDAIHQRPKGTARKRFNDNHKRFIESEDYFKVSQPSEFRTLGFERPQGGTPEQIILITEFGYLMLVKSFTDDLAWKAQRTLVNSYFRSKTKPADAIFHRQLDLAYELSKRTSIPLDVAILTAINQTEYITGENFTCWKELLTPVYKTNENKQSVVYEFFEKFQRLFTWNMIPTDFLYDLYS